MERQSNLSLKIVENLRFPLILVVVLIHCNYVENLKLDISSEAPVFCGVLEFLQHNVYTVAVPLFFFISGYMFFRNGVPTAGQCAAKLRRRLRTLVVPYLAWNSIFLAVLLLKAGPLLVSYFPQYTTFDLSAVDLLKGFIAYPYGESFMPYDRPLWFLRNLIAVLAAAPVILYVFRWLRWPAVVLPAALSFLWPEFFYGYFYNVYFFMLGAAVPAMGRDLSLMIDRAGWWPLAVWTVCVVLEQAGAGVPYIISTTAGLLSVLYLGLLAVSGGFAVSPMLRNATFFIYAFHDLLMSAITKIIARAVMPDGEVSAWVCYVLIFFAAVGLSLAVYGLSRRFIPGVLSFVCGGR